MFDFVNTYNDLVKALLIQFYIVHGILKHQLSFKNNILGSISKFDISAQKITALSQFSSSLAESPYKIFRRSISNAVISPRAIIKLFQLQISEPRLIIKLYCTAMLCKRVVSEEIINAKNQVMSTQRPLKIKLTKLATSA